MLCSMNFGTSIREPINIPDCNSFEGFIQRTGTACLEGTAQITGDNETVTTNVFKYSGPILIVEQWAVITDDTALTNATNIYADIWDGTTAEDLTNDGMTLSGAPVGSFFTKDELATETYTLMLADQGRVLETTGPKVGGPFLINGKNGVDNFIRFHVTTNTTLDFSMFVHFEYQVLNGGTMEFA